METLELCISDNCPLYHLHAIIHFSLENNGIWYKLAAFLRVLILSKFCLAQEAVMSSDWAFILAHNIFFQFMQIVIYFSLLPLSPFC